MADRSETLLTNLSAAVRSFICEIGGGEEIRTPIKRVANAAHPYLATPPDGELNRLKWHTDELSQSLAFAAVLEAASNPTWESVY